MEKKSKLVGEEIESESAVVVPKITINFISSENPLECVLVTLLAIFIYPFTCRVV